MTDYHRGDIFLVDFDPSVGHEFQKIRPAVIIQSDKIIKNGSLVTVMAITSNLKNRCTRDIYIKKLDNNGLFKDSIVKVGAIHSFDSRRLLKKIGIGQNDVLEKIADYLRTHFDL